MGNHIICENYYCNSVAYKPEWISNSNWDINYNYEIDKLPYNIDKGKLKLKDVKKFDILLSKKVYIELDKINSFSIPINIKYYLLNNNDIDIFIIFSDKILTLDTLNNTFNSINLNLTKNNLFIYRTFNNDTKKLSIKTNKINTIEIKLDYNFELLLFSEIITNHKNKNIYENKYLTASNLINNFYLNIFIKNKKGLIKKEYLELNIE